jgi:soluble lytic murein transglycosylase-like protein
LRLLWCSLLLSLASLSLNAQTVKYDLAFKHWGELYAPAEDWHWWKAQARAESNLNPLAVSSVGAIGIMQLMPATAKSLDVDPHDPESNIRGGIRYDAICRKLWEKAPTATDARNLMFASYNAGPGNIAKAAKLAGSQIWDSVAAVLAKVTGKYSTQTTEYVARINRLMQ